MKQKNKNAFKSYMIDKTWAVVNEHVAKNVAKSDAKNVDKNDAYKRS